MAVANVIWNLGDLWCVVPRPAAKQSLPLPNGDRQLHGQGSFGVAGVVAAFAFALAAAHPPFLLPRPSRECSCGLLSTCFWNFWLLQSLKSWSTATPAFAGGLDFSNDLLIDKILEQNRGGYSLAKHGNRGRSGPRTLIAEWPIWQASIRIEKSQLPVLGIVKGSGVSATTATSRGRCSQPGQHNLSLGHLALVPHPVRLVLTCPFPNHQRGVVATQGGALPEFAPVHLRGCDPRLL